ncbi:MAG: phage major capsid protein, P2 family [Desulfotalea sp.]
MEKQTQKRYSALRAKLAKTFGVQDVTQQFTAEPAPEQRMSDKIVEQSTFLPKINVIPVTHQSGNNILGSAKTRVSGRTNTSTDGVRTPRSLVGLTPVKYNCVKTNSDVYVSYELMDAWAHLTDFSARYANYLYGAIANDREIIGWFGEEVAEDTDLAANPNLEDVNKGWMQKVREGLPANILTEGAISGELRIGPGGDFVNLDEAISDLVEGIPQYLRAGLVALVGSDLVGREKSALYKAIANKPTEKNEATESLKSFGGLPYETPSNFPARGIVITSFDNLSIYLQRGTWRRNLKDTPEKDRTEDYNSRNEDYVVECLEKFIAVEFKNVKLPTAAGDAWA